MREIKFRAWVSKAGRTWMETCIGVKPFHITDGDRFIWKREEVALMQYTGLRDKNGKEIYEGDIIRYHVESTTKIKVVIFREGMFATDISSLKAVRLISEVIGNIYENPELLETNDGSH